MKRKMKFDAKDRENSNEFLTMDDFLRVLDRAICPPKPPDQEIDKTSEKSDSDYCNEKHIHSDNVEDI